MIVKSEIEKFILKSHFGSFFNSQDLIYLVILITVCNKIDMMVIRRIWNWIY